MLGNPQSNISKVWFVLHGYAMLSEFFIQKFKNLDDGNTLIIAPEALNRFYINDYYNRVGASWMTKEERETDIKENIDYLNLLSKKIFKEIGHTNFKLNILGFSQGGATACRWMFASHMKINNLILWASDLPKDTLIEKNRSVWENINTHLVMGKKDQLISSEVKTKFLDLVKEYSLKYELTLYDGDHRIYPDVMFKLAQGL
jgi:predicted esterase